MPFYVYILQSDLDQSFYTGHTADLDERVRRHNDGRSCYTKTKRPWKLVYQEQCSSRSEATQRERTLKALHRKDLLQELINASR